LQADAFTGFNTIFETGRVIKAACWANARWKFYDIHVLNLIADYPVNQVDDLLP